uniref:Cell death activator CIDE-B n=1 Tax=Cacopsylla melanoneura TaxID=428564 RepID=A0A8D8SJS4_9HEMI
MEQMDEDGSGLPFKVVDCSREKKIGIVALSLKDLMNRARLKLGMSNVVKVVLDLDGTEVDEEEYFSTLERNTSLMILSNNDKWTPSDDNATTLTIERNESNNNFTGYLTKIHGNNGVSILGGLELELLSDMDPESLTDIIPDKLFLDQFKEVSGRFFSNKNQHSKETLELLKLYHQSTRDPGYSNGETVQ